jgi:guanine nucleotide-binding protein G(i) subunit alpha
LKRVCTKSYEPSKQDILHCRRKTVGVATENIEVDGVKLTLSDVGGQRNERKKWTKVLSSVDILIYIISLSDYDEVLYENQDINKMKEALEVFDNTINLDWFRESPIILIFNKKDMLEKKIQEEDTLKKAFSSYKGKQRFNIQLEGGKNPKAAEEFIQTMFLDLYKGNPSNIHKFSTSVLDPESARESYLSVIEEAKDLIVTGKVKEVNPTKKK